MKISVSLVDLKNALNLTIINSNISKFYTISCITQMQIVDGKLIINTVAQDLCSEARINGIDSDSGSSELYYVDSKNFKSLIFSLSSALDVVTVELNDNSAKIYANTSRYIVPKMLESNVSSDAGMKRPTIDTTDAKSCGMSSSNWKYVKDHQMYALSTTSIHPIYSKIWVGVAGDIIVGDFSKNLFTHSTKSTLNRTCLVTNTMINLLCDLPDNAEMYELPSGDYLLCATYGDSLSYYAEVAVDNNAKDYQAEYLFRMLVPEDDTTYVEAYADEMCALISRARMLSTNNTPLVELKMDSHSVVISSDTVYGEVDVTDGHCDEYSMKFMADLLYNALSKYLGSYVKLSPLYRGSLPIGIRITDDTVCTILTGMTK